MIIRVIQHRLQVQTRKEDAAGCYKKKIILYISKMYNTCNTVRSVYYVFMKLPYKNTQFVISDYSCSCLRVRSFGCIHVGVVHICIFTSFQSQKKLLKLQLLVYLKKI